MYMCICCVTLIFCLFLSAVTMLSRYTRPLAQVAARFTSQAAKSTAAAPHVEIGQTSQQVFERENKYGAHNYQPLPVAISKGYGTFSKVGRAEYL